jgi:AbiTii
LESLPTANNSRGQYTCVDVLTSLEGNKRFRTWVEKELDGYDQTDELPEYRRVRAIAKGHFLGGFCAQINISGCLHLFLTRNRRKLVKACGVSDGGS